MTRSTFTTDAVLYEVYGERSQQDTKWGEQNHPDGTGSMTQIDNANFARQACQDAFAAGVGTWCHVLEEEVCEAMAESDAAKLRAELIQVAAVATAWVEAIDRRAT